jgi:hypothetical protein
VLGHLGLQGSLDEPGGELLEDAVFAGQVLRPGIPGQELVDHLVGDRVFHVGAMSGGPFLSDRP